jgi:membrane-associated protease RseP (regulator of RpoE activity)
MNLGLNIFGWLLFLIGIGASIALHEVGHLVPAKRFGVKVTQYMVGFGPTLWARHKGETEYGIKAIPLGGYIRMIGMFPPERNADGTWGDESQLRRSSTGRFAALVDDARRTSLDEVAPEDADRVFYKLPVHRKIVVMLGGPFMNLFIAAVLFTIILVGFGVPEATNKVGLVSPCVPTQAEVEDIVDRINDPSLPDPPARDENAPCTAGESPAALSGLQAGDRITSFDGTTVSTWTEVRTAIRESDPGPTPIVVERDGRSITLSAPMVEAPRPKLEGDAVVGVEQGPYLGVVPARELVPQSITAVPATMWDISIASGRAIITLPWRLYDVAQSTFTDAPRDPEGLVGVVGVGRISGEVVATDQLANRLKFLTLLQLLAGLNLFLFLFNLIPLLPLDGGHVAGALWEGAKKSWARFRGKPDPGPVDVAKALPLAYTVSFLLIGMSILLIYADLVEPIRLGL